MHTVTKKELVDRIADKTNSKRVVVKEIVQSFLNEVIDELGSGDQATRRQAIAWAVGRAASSEDTLRRLNDALDTENDQKFLAICSVLKQLKKFHTPKREGIWLDRWRCLQLEGMQKAALALADSQPAKSHSTKPAGVQQKKMEIAAWTRQSIMFEFVISGSTSRFLFYTKSRQ